MTTHQVNEQVRQNRQYGNAYTRLVAGSQHDFFGMTEVSAEQQATAGVLLDAALNNEKLIMPITNWERPKPQNVDAISRFMVDPEDINPIIKGMFNAMRPYSRDDVGYVDMLSAMESLQKTTNTVLALGYLARNARATHKEHPTFIAVAANIPTGTPDQPQPYEAGLLYRALSELPANEFRIAVVGQPMGQVALIR